MPESTAPATLLVVEDDPFIADQLRWALQDAYQMSFAASREEAVAALERTNPDLILLDLCLPPGNEPEEGFRVLRAARARDLSVVVTSAVEEREAALRAVAEGACDFLGKPVELPVLRVVVARALEKQALERENRRLRDQLRERFELKGVVGISRPMQGVFDAVKRVADSPVTVILEGESGTGKGLLARTLHFNGTRRDGPFVALHCAALPESLLEAELFGHEKGAFTGAHGARVGRFEAAHGGTLFLDEIGCISPAVQIKLLQVIEERTVERLGSNRPRPVDIRLVVATNENLEEKVRRGQFREDLFFRVNVFPIRLPALRERREDLPLLADHFLKTLCRERGLPEKRLAEDARESLLSHSWPGNVRELHNVIETLLLLADGETIRAADVKRACPGCSGEARPRSTSGTLPFKTAVEEFERNLLLDALRRAGGVKAQAARELGLDSSQMKYLSKKYKL